MTPSEVARHAALVRWKKESPFAARLTAARQAKKPKDTRTRQEIANQNRASIAQQTGLGADLDGAMARLKAGMGGAADEKNADALVGRGLAKKDPTTGRYSLTPEGNRYYRAAAKGDADGARVAMGDAKDRKASRDAKQGERQAKQAEREKAKADKATAKEKEKKGKGGGGGGGAKEPKPSEEEKAKAKEAERLRLRAERDADREKRDAATEARIAARDERRQAERDVQAAQRKEETAAERAKRQAETDVRTAERDAARQAETAARDAARTAERATAAAATVAAEAQRQQAERDDVTALLDDWEAGRTGLGYKDQRRAVRMGLARYDDAGNIRRVRPQP